MAAYVSNIVVDVGANFDQSFNLETNANAPMNLTGFTGAAKLKKSAMSLTTAAHFVVSFPDVLQGQLKISLGSTSTRSLDQGRYMFDVLVDKGGTTYPLASGNVMVINPVSSAP